MGPRALLLLTPALLSLLTLPAPRLVAQQPSIHVDVGRPLHSISPDLYGIFFEEINHAGDGGLYAELVRNRAFEDAAAPDGWTPAASGSGTAELSIDAADPLNVKSPHSLRVDARDVGRGYAGAANGGYWGMAVTARQRYRLSFRARRDQGLAGPLLVRLEGADGRPLAERKIPGLATQWRPFETTLTPRATDAGARLVIAALAPGTFWLDVVSLMPEKTFKGRPNGLRADLARMLDEMGPSFVRFPGGCFVEGDKLANATRWKQTIGDIAERPGHWNLWGYRSSDGLGYHEYLQMCEDLGAEPLFVINCGMAHADSVPLAELQPWVQDALDAIEYANGPVTSTWGSLRAQAGHPAPFNLKYVEIGNENGGAPYEERYARFYDAIRRRYPAIQIIANVRVSGRPYDLVDDHYYSNPDWFIANAGLYDARPRTGPKVYVGEYAVTQGCGQGNLIAAVAEAAFMTGLERNSDLVAMASYAPLFVNVRNRAWNPDAIGFDAARCYGTPSYYVQTMFSRVRADVLLPTTVKAAREQAPVDTGAIGVGTWSTRAEFRDVRVTQGGRSLFAEDFASGADRWRPVHGSWSVTDGAYRQSAEAVDVRSVAGDPAWTDYTLTLKARKLGGAEGFLILFHAKDDANWSWWNIGGWGNSRHAIERSVGGAKATIGESVAGSVETGRWYDIRVEVAGPRIRCYLDGALVHDVMLPAKQPIYAVAGRNSTKHEIVLKVVNVTGQPQETAIALDGAPDLASTAEAVVLTGDGPDAENSLDHPERVAPVTRSLTGISPAFVHTFPPYSVTVMRIREADAPTRGRR